MANKFYVKPATADISPILSGIGSILKQNREEKMKAENAKSLMDAYKSGDADAVAGLIASNPELGGSLSAMLNHRNDITEKNYSESVRDLMGTTDPQKRADILANRIYMLDENQADSTQSQMALSQLNEDPEGFNKALELEYARTQPKQAWDAYKSQMGISTSTEPATVQEWKFFNKLDKKDQTRFLDMKRKGYSISEVGGVNTMVNTNDPSAPAIPLSTLESEATAEKVKSGARQLGAAEVSSQFNEINRLIASEGGRTASLKKAEKFHDLISSGEMNSGGMRKLLSYVPFTFTKQGELDEEFNAFAEVAARQSLKANGEVRPTDADVTGMKQAMFGIGRSEEVNKALLKDYIDAIKRDELKSYQLTFGKKDQQSAPAVNAQGWQLMTDANGNQAYVGPNGEIEEVR